MRGLLQRLDAIRRLVARRVAELREAGYLPSPERPFAGAFVGPEEVDARLDSGTPPWDATLEDAVAEVLPAPEAGSDCPLARLALRLRLDATDHALLSLVAAPALSQDVARLYAYLRNDLGKQSLSAGLVADLLSLDGTRGMPELMRRLRPGAPLLELALVVTPPGGAAAPRDDLTLAPRVLDWLLDPMSEPAELAGVSRLDASAALPEPILAEPAASEVATLRETVTRAASEGALALVPVPVLVGPVGAGRGLVAAALARSLDQQLLRVDCEVLTRAAGEGADRIPRVAALLRAAVREAKLQGALLHLDACDQLPSEADPAVQAIVNARLELWTMATTKGLAGRAMVPASRPSRSLALRLPEEPERRALWDRYLPKHRFKDASARERLVQRYRMSGRQIYETAAAALHPMAAGRNGRISAELLDRVIAERLDHGLAAVAERMEPRLGLSDVVLSSEATFMVRLLLAHLEHRAKVLEDWGFSRFVRRGLGVSALFSGPPGTGKTLTAGAIALELGMALYRVELSQVVSKWVGETEKQLDRVFREAEAAHAIILFDEADSLFAKRTDVSSVQDRYANLEVNYLLQKMEEFTGVTLLTTNLLSSIDEAFLRRITFRVEFAAPRADERAKLWQIMVPPEATLHPEVDFATLGERFEFAGGHIRNAVFQAAFLAAELGRPIDQELLEVCGTLENRQKGTVTRGLDYDALIQRFQSDAD